MLFRSRGVGASQGRSTDGPGEIEDMMAVIDHHQADPALRGLPLSLAGFSFGGFVAASAHARLTQSAQHLVLVSPATRLQPPPVPPHTLLLQGEADDVVALPDILDWARPQGLPVTVVPGVGHFFHGHLPLLRELVLRHLRGRADDADDADDAAPGNTA